MQTHTQYWNKLLLIFVTLQRRTVTVTTYHMNWYNCHETSFSVRNVGVWLNTTSLTTLRSTIWLCFKLQNLFLFLQCHIHSIVQLHCNVKLVTIWCTQMFCVIKVLKLSSLLISKQPICLIAIAVEFEEKYSTDSCCKWYVYYGIDTYWKWV